MRLSLSVPDALWLQACEAYRLWAPSRLVQAALAALVADPWPDDLQGPPAAARQRLARLQDRLRAEARAAYEEGYEAGLGLADVLDWWVVEQLADADWRLDRLPARGRTNPVLDELRRGLAGDVSPDSTYARGLLAALRDCLAVPPVASGP